jgi:hypothetical protein
MHMGGGRHLAIALTPNLLDPHPELAWPSRQASPDGMTGAYSTVATVVRVTQGAVLPDLIIRLIIQTILLDPSGSDQIDDPSNVSRPDPPGAVQIDAEHPSRNRKAVRVRFAPPSTAIE